MTTDTEKVDVWMPFYPGDYLRDTNRLNTEQHGAYFLLILDYWCNGPPPNNNEVLRAITRQSGERWAVTRPTLEPYFQVSDGKWRHRRVEREYEAALKRKRDAVDQAKRAAAARWDAQRNAPSTASSPSPSSSPALESKDTVRLTPHISPFDKFWDTWPNTERKRKKKDCHRLWIGRRLDDQAGEILEHVKTMKRSGTWKDGDEPSPLTYLDQQRWHDPLPPDIDEEPPHE